MKPKYAIAITGASGTRYGIRLIEIFLEKEIPFYLTISDAAAIVFREELNVELGYPGEWEENLLQYLGPKATELVHYLDRNDLAAPISSGSNKLEGYVIVPCSMSTLAGIANGISSNLIERAADVALKEHRKMVIVPRETPLSAIHLENMLKLSRLGVRVVPASPGFYSQPSTIEEMIDFVVGRILDQLEIEHNLLKRWKADIS